MSGWIAFGCFLLLGITDAVFAWKLNGEPWAFLMAGDPKLPDGEYVYVPSRFQQAAKLLCLFYAVVFFLSALAALLTQALRVLPSGCMAGILYLHGAVLTLIAFGMLAYLDSYCQTKNEVLVEAEEG